MNPLIKKAKEIRERNEAKSQGAATPTTVLEVVPTMQMEVMPNDVVQAGRLGEPSLPMQDRWYHARSLWQQAQGGAQAIVELGLELQALREEFFAQGAGGGGDRMSEEYKTTSSEVRTKCSSMSGLPAAGTATGWQMVLKKELGMTKQTALRLMEKAQYVQMMQCIENGEDVSFYHKGLDQQQVMLASADAQVLAKQLLSEVLAGLLNPARAWAGLCGEGKRSEIGKQRQETDSAKLIAKALVTLDNQCRHWDTLTREDRMNLESLWDDVRSRLPTTWWAKKFTGKDWRVDAR